MGLRLRVVCAGLTVLHCCGWLARPMRSYAFQKLLGNEGRIHGWRLLGASIEDNVKIGPRVRIRTPSHVEIGAGTWIGGRLWIDSWGLVRIGRNVAINDDVLLLTASHLVDSPTLEGEVRPITIGDYAWLPTRIVILPGVSIGEAAVVGTGSVVARDVAEYTVVAGNPAKVISRRARQQFRYVPSEISQF